MTVSFFPSSDVVHGLYWSIICCCSSIGTILCNTMAQNLSSAPRNIYIFASFLVLGSSVPLFFLFPANEDDSVEVGCRV